LAKLEISYRFDLIKKSAEVFLENEFLQLYMSALSRAEFGNHRTNSHRHASFAEAGHSDRSSTNTPVTSPVPTDTFKEKTDMQ